MATQKHIHKYRRVDIGKAGRYKYLKANIEREGKSYFVMKCIKPGCSNYTPMVSKVSAPLLRDTLAECNRCGERFLLNKRALRMAEPCCDNCVKRKVNVKVTEAEKFFIQLEEGLKQ